MDQNTKYLHHFITVENICLIKQYSNGMAFKYGIMALCCRFIYMFHTMVIHLTMIRRLFYNMYIYYIHILHLRMNVQRVATIQ